MGDMELSVSLGVELIGEPNKALDTGWLSFAHCLEFEAGTFEDVVVTPSPAISFASHWLVPA